VFHQFKLIRNLFVVLLLFTATGATSFAQQVNVETWSRVEIDISNTSFSGNPFELEVDAVFTHQSSGDSLRLPGYYSGNNIWTISFMPTKQGEWDYITESTDVDLNSVSGTVSASASNRQGLLAPDPTNSKKWRFANGDYVLPIALRMEFFSEPATAQEFSAAADFMNQNNLLLMETRLLEEYGQFGGRFDFIFDGDWTNHEFDLQIWDQMQERMDSLAARGLGAHIMFYSDDGGKPGWSGASNTERLVIRYVVARLAAYPIVIFNSGIDIAEYRSQADVDFWAAELQSIDPYDHPVSSRHGGGSGAIVASSQTFDSRGDRTARISVIRSNYQSASIPVSQDDAWGENRGSHPEKDHRPEDIRRAAWKCLVSGGVGFLMRGGGDGLSVTGFYSIKQVASDLESEQWLRYVNPFISSDLENNLGQMEPVDNIASGSGVYALATPDASSIVVLQIGPNDRYDNGARDITIDLNSQNGTWSSTWFDPRSGNKINNSALQGGDVTTLQSPSADDWILLLKNGSSPVAPLPPTDLTAE